LNLNILGKDNIVCVLLVNAIMCLNSIEEPVDAHFLPKSKTTQSKVSIFVLKPKHGPNPISLLQTRTSRLGHWQQITKAQIKLPSPPIQILPA
jgi:hypothetical protein